MSGRLDAGFAEVIHTAESQFDHMTPVSRGGETVDENLTTACRDCNRQKRAKTADEFRAVVLA
jgi:5-methylcytosine-specific restriction endonuclease McrA